MFGGVGNESVGGGGSGGGKSTEENHGIGILVVGTREGGRGEGDVGTARVAVGKVRRESPMEAAILGIGEVGGRRGGEGHPVVPLQMAPQAGAVGDRRAMID